MNYRFAILRSSLFTAAVLVGSFIPGLVPDAQSQDLGTGCVAAPAGLVGWWQAEGNASDAAGGNNGSITGTVRFVPGEVGLGFEFDGATSAVTVPASTNLTVESLTVEAWIFPYDISSPHPIVEYAGPTGLASVHLWYGLTAAPGGATGTPGALYGLLRDPGGAALQVGTAAGLIPSNRWTHVALTFDSAARTAALFVNGVNVASNISPVAIQPQTSLPINIGYRPPGSGELLAGTRHLGGLDEVSIYNRALSATELQSIYIADEQGKCPLAAPTNCVPVPAGLVSWWRAEGNGKDSSGTNDGALVNGVTCGPGIVGQAFHFVSGPNPKVYLPDNPTLQLTNSLSIEGWVKANFGWSLLTRGDDRPSMDAYVFGFSSATSLVPVFSIFDGGNQYAVLTAPTPIPTNIWVHLAATLDGNSGSMRIYVNGVPVAQTNTTVRPAGVLTGANPSLSIGNAPGSGGFPFDGWIDEISLYSHALSQAEIEAIYNAGSAGKCTGATAPTISSQPASQTTSVGGTAVFNVTATGSPPLSFQWLFNGGNLTGKTGSSLVLSNVQPANEGNYSVLVSNVVGTVLSSNALLTVLSSGTNCVSPPSGLVGWWRAEGDGKDSAGTNDAALVNGVICGPGKVGQAFHFISGPNPKVYVPDNPTLQLTNSLTIEGWVKANFGWSLLTRGDDRPSMDPYVFGFTSVSSLIPVFSIFDGGSQYAVLTAPTPIPTNVWLHLAATLDGNSGAMSIYVNGVQVAQTNTTVRPAGVLTGANPSLCVGNAPGSGGFPFDGWIDEISLYSRALSQAEIQAIYNAGSAGKCTGATAPAITAQPATQTVSEGGAAVFNVTATGTLPLSYQWRFNGSDLTGQTGSLLVMSNVQPANGGNYSVLVSNLVGSVLSSNAMLTVLPRTNNCVPPSSGLVSWWRAEGNGKDSAGTNDGVLINGATCEPGLVGQAFHFISGPNPKVYVPDNPTLQLTNSLTIEGWVKANFGWHILSRGDDRPAMDPYAFSFTSASSRTPFFRIFDGGTQYAVVTAPAPIPTNVWLHLAATLDGDSGAMRIYVNGMQVAQTNTTLRPAGPLTGANPSLCIGNAPGSGGFPLDGWIDEISLYSRALSQTEIEAIYNAGSAGKCASTPMAVKITAQPAGLTVNVGGTAVFNVTATGSPPLSYQWLFGGTNLVGQTGTSLVLSNVQPANGGIYSVLVSNTVGSVLSSNAVLTVLSATNDCVPAPSGLVGWWRGEGNANDSAGTNNGAVINSVYLEPGLVGQCFHFVSGPNPRVLIPDSPALRLTNSLTIEGWIKANFGYWLLNRGDDTVGELPYGLGFVDGDPRNRTLGFIVHASVNDWVWLRTPFQLPTNVWVHVAATLDGGSGDMRIYVNGQVAAETNTTVRPVCPLTGANRSVAIGNSAGTAGFPFDGWIDEIALYSRALSQLEIQTIYNAGSAGKCTGATAPAITAQPASQTVSKGDTALFSVTATGTAPLRYQWLFNGSNLVGQTGTSLVLSNVQPANGGNYSVLVSNLVGSVLSSNAVLTVLSSGTNCVPAPSGLVSWWRAEGNGNDSAGTNEGTLLHGVSFAAGMVGQAFRFVSGPNPKVYVADNPTLQLTNSLSIEAWIKPNFGWTLLSRGDDTLVADPYTFGFTSVSDLKLIFRIVDASGQYLSLTAPEPLATSVWVHVAATLDGGAGIASIYVNGQVVAQTNTVLRPKGPLTGANPSVCIGNAPGTTGFPFDGLIDEIALYSRALSQAELQAIYSAGSAGKCTGATAPAITAQPASQTVSEGGTALFSVTATGSPPLSYQWLFGGTNLVGQTGTSLVLSNVQPVNAGTYSVLVSNIVGSVLSSNAVLTVLLPTNNCVPAPSGLVGWWRAEGDANDAVGGNNGVIGGNVTFGPGEVGQAFIFDGSTSAVTVPASSNLAVRSFTIEAWVLPFDVRVPFPVVEYAGANGPGYVQLWCGMTNTSGPTMTSPGAVFGLVREQNGPYMRVWTAGGLVASNQWNHVALTFDAESRTAVLYVNGFNAGSNASSVAIQAQTWVPVNLGYRPPLSSESFAGRRLLGKLDEVSIYSRALSAAELLAIYNAGSAGKCPSGLAPRITTQPADQTALVGGTATFNVKATGAAPLNYQWRFNGTNLPGQTSAWLTLSNIQMSNAGSYAALVTNQVAAVLSSNALLTVIALPTNCVPAPSGLVGWWPGEGNADDAAGGNNGIIGGNLTFVPGEVGQTFNFDGVTSAVTVPASTALAVHSLTIEAWVAPYDISHPRPIVEYAGPTGPGYVQLWYGITAAPGGATGAPGALYGLLRDPGGAALQVGSSAGLLPSNQWSHVALTFDYTARIARLYVNGVNVASNGSPIAVQPLTAVPVNIGYRPPQSSELLAGARHLGKLDEVSLYNRVLSPGEIQSIYQSGSAGKCPVAPPPSCVSPGAGMVSWWRAQGNAQDAVGPNSGNLMNGTGFASGKVGMAFVFNGVNQLVQVPDAPSLNPTNSLSIEGWVNVAGYSSNDGVVIVGKDNPYAVRQYLLSLGNVSGQWVFRPHVGVPGGLRYFNGTMPIQLNTWYHVAMTYDGFSLKLFVNGIPDGSLTVSGPIVTSAEPLLIGGSVPGPWYFNGLVDELTLYSRALSLAEIQAIYAAGGAGKCSIGVRPNLANISVGTIQNQSLSLATQDLLALAAPTGIPLVLSSVSGTSTNGGTVSLQTNSVVYAPPANFVGLDRFTYTANGVQGGPASAYVLVEVRPNSLLTGRLLPATAIPSGFQLSVVGAPGSTYTLERAPSVNGPWTILNTVTVGPDGLGSVTDTNPAVAAAFYRARPQ